MREIGVITKIEKGKAKVKVDKKDECSKCGMCLFPKNASSVEFDAENDLNAKVGDTVIIETQKEGKLFGAFLAFLVPLILIGLSFLLNYLVIKNELITLAIAIGAIAIWYVILAFIDKKIKNTVSFSARITQIIEMEDNKTDEIETEDNKEEK